MNKEKYYWLNDESRLFLSRGYINETPEQRIKDIANKAEEYLKIDGFADKFEDYMARGFYSLSTPVWINFGKEKGLPISCYGSNIDDTLDSILNAGREIGMMSKYGGGTSAYLGNIRARGSKISTGGTADGPVHYARVYDTVVDVCKQSEARRGACAVWLPAEHDDIMEFLDIGTEGNPIQNLQYGVTVTDNWINDMKGGDPSKRKIWAKIIQRRNEFGFPYIMFKDNSNNNSPYKELGMEITASNLCLTEDQRVVTTKGYLTVKELHESGEELVLFSGSEAVKSSPMLLRNEDAEILKITYSNGMTQKVTFNHGIPVLNDTTKDIVRVEAKDLKIGDYVALQTEKGLFGDLDMQGEAYLLGTAATILNDNYDKQVVPSFMWKANEATVKSFLDGFFTYSKSNIGGIYIGDTKFVYDLQILFSNLGLYCKVDVLDNNQSKLTIKEHNDEVGVSVVAIEQLDNEPVYCPTIDNDEHIFVSNGLRTFNCSEIQLPTNSLNSFVCCLGSLNLLHWDEIVETDAIEVYTMFLNAVMDEFILKSGKMAGMKRANRFASQHRAIGLGVLGYHSLFQSKLIPFESLMAKQLNHQIFKIIKEKSELASKYLYEEKGYKCLREGYANTTLIAIAPTKSSSFILGQVSMGIEPIKSNYFIKDLAKSKTIYKNPFLEIELDKYGLNTPETWESILKKDGSVQHLDFPTKEVFKSFIEISPKELILQAAQRQKFIDQSQSLNLMIHPSVPAKDINQLYLYAHEEGVKTLYYQFSQSSAQSFARNINECVSCES
jgi:ribonucleotide reductase alpha subunit